MIKHILAKNVMKLIELNQKMEVYGIAQNAIMIFVQNVLMVRKKYSKNLYNIIKIMTGKKYFFTLIMK